MRRLSDGSAISEARRFKTLTLGRAVGSGGAGVAMPQPTVQNQMIIANAAIAWTLLAAPSAEGQVPITGADPYTPVWTARFDATVPNTIEPDDAAAAGSATVAAKRDHEHAIVCAASASPSVSLSASAEGSGTSFARADHAHQLDQTITPTWTALHLFNAGIRLSGASGANVIAIPNNVAQAMHVADMGGKEYLRIVSLDAQSAVVFNESGADVDHRWEASGQANALFIQGSTGNIGAKTNDPLANHHVVGSTVANKHIAGYYSSAVQILEKAAGCGLQIIADDGSTGASYIMLSNAPSSGDNKHWIMHHLGTGGSDRLFIGYVTSNVTDFSPYSGVSEYFTISTAGAVHIIENSATVRLTGTKQFVWSIPNPSVGTYGQVRIPWACTVRRVDGNIVGGTSCTVNVEERATPGGAGTDILSSDMVADANGESVTAGFNNSTLAAGAYLTVDVSAVSGAVAEVNIAVTVTLT